MAKVEEKINTEEQKKGKKAWSIISKCLMGLLCVILAMLIVVTGWLAIDKFIRKSKVPSFAGYSILKVETGSMEGTIMEGDLILIKKTGDYKIGDIITFAHANEKIPTTHRIINYADESEQVFITRGDANKTQDSENVTKDEVFGEVVLTMHVLGLVTGWVTDGGGYIYVISGIIILGLGAFLINYIRKRSLQLEEGEVAEVEEQTSEQTAQVEEMKDDVIENQEQSLEIEKETSEQ